VTALVTTRLDAALEYARQNVPVFPVWWPNGVGCACGKPDCPNAGKHPIGALVPRGFRDGTTDAAVIRGWWATHPEANIGTPTSWCVVLDVDPRHGGDDSLAALERQHGALPDTAEVLTGGGGRHIYFKPSTVPIRPSAGKVGAGLDVRGDGGYVLLPPSLHLSGREYADELVHPLFETPLAPLPAWLVALATDDGNRNGHATAYVTPETIGEGERNHLLFRLGRSLHAKQLTEQEILATLRVSNQERCRPPLADVEVRAIAHSAATQPDRPDFGAAARPAESRQATSAPPVTASAGGDDGPILVSLADVVPEAVEWLWPDRIARGKLTLIIGEPGEGKSFLTHDLAARTTRGGTWPDGTPTPNGAVIILASEDGIADTVRPRVDRQQGDASRIHILRAVRTAGQETPFNLESDLAMLEQALVTTGALVLIIDPLSSYLGSRDSYKDSEIRGILTPLAALAERHRVAVVGVLHLTKAAQKRLLLRAQGSVAFVAQARTVLAVGQDPETPGRRLLVPIKNNLGPTAPALAFHISDDGLRWDSTPVDGTAESLLAIDEPITRAAGRERDTASTFLRTILAEGPVASKQIEADAKANGIAQRTLWRAKDDLGILTERARAQDGRPSAWYWMLPPPGGAR
jgi:hypothetical protein